MVLCLTQLSVSHISSADRGPLSAVGGLQVIDARGSVDAPLTQAIAMDSSFELSEPILPPILSLLPVLDDAQPVGYLALTLPHPLIERPQKPPRGLQA